MIREATFGGLVGLYVHIPFCKQKCSYCDFHFSTDLSYREDMLAAIRVEFQSRKEELRDQEVQTIYFGGGTPSIIDSEGLSRLIQEVRKASPVSNELEISLEANPDDMSRENLLAWKSVGVNRLSIGVQSFDDTLLTSMNRSHSSMEALKAIALAKEIGFNSLSLDIIFGLPEEGMKTFESVVQEFIDLQPDHISAYALTLEKRTAYQHRFDKGDLPLPDEDEVQRQFLYLIDELLTAGFEQYEVSNFAKPGHISKHNSAYWRGVPYVGIGPSAHSFDGKTRRWNVSNNRRYMSLLKEEAVYWEEEEIDAKKAFNEHVMTRSRTKWGLDLVYIESLGIDLLESSMKILNRYEGCYDIDEDHLILNRSGLLLADRFASDLFLI